MASDSTFVQAVIPCFDGHYDHWSMLMENFLRSKEYWYVVESGIDEPTKDVDLNVKNYPFSAINLFILKTILSKETSKHIWDSMKKNYFVRTMEVSNKMRFHGNKLEDVTIVEKILRSLTLEFDHVVYSIKESKDINALSLDELQSSLLVHEQKMNRSSTIEDLLFSFLNEDFNSTVSFGDFSIVNVMGKDDIKIKTKNGFVKTISNVLYIPSLKSNLLSTGQLQEKGYVIIIKTSSCEIYDPVRDAIAIAPMNSSRLFALKIEIFESCLMTELKDPSWTYVENEAGKTIKTLQFCKNHGIRRKLTIAYIPQKNGVSERKNRTVLNMQLTPIILDNDDDKETQPAENSSNASAETSNAYEILPVATSATS
ncbi:hypothetical protein K2173_009979 [Erythroxylum novogranatense]|uniref:Retrovirus-related Pol polyprotein from transposon TNT 1-94-like beta-barrel domain-containing protein n=1 Tax=Erythroxylum novogranatense TaxID=1862640 RepID=A0AAV8T0Z1_9ROSI|nr:hypothetical protein K2173_009979 [Erythroxylum novogranatense]